MDPLRFPQDICNTDCLFVFAPNYSFEYNHKKYGFYSNKSTTVKNLKSDIAKVIHYLNIIINRLLVLLVLVYSTLNLILL